jgi:hypothetical protein
MGARGDAFLFIPNAANLKTIMPTSNTNDLLIDAQKILDTWKANSSFNIGSKITLESFTQDRDQLTALDNAIESRRIELQGLINERNDLGKNLRTQITRIRSGFRAVYGPDSTQYDQAGATRTSERKARTARKPAVTTAK